MRNDKMEITDELLACYLEGKLTANEKAAVEQYLSEHDEALDAVMLARYELSYKRSKRRFLVYGVLALLLVGFLALLIWRLLTPLQMKVNITEDKAFAVPALPFEGGILECEYAGNALQRITVSPDNATVFLNDIPYHLKGSPVHLVFEAEGYQTIDTVWCLAGCATSRMVNLSKAPWCACSSIRLSLMPWDNSESRFLLTNKTSPNACWLPKKVTSRGMNYTDHRLRSLG